MPSSSRSRALATALALSLAVLSVVACGSTASRQTQNVARATATPTPRCTTSDVLATWTLDRLAAQVIVVPADEGDVAAVQTEVSQGAGGVVLFGSAAPANLAAQLQALTASAPSRITPFVMSDEEGGAVQRMANMVGSIPSARQMGATMSSAQIELLAEHLATRLRAAGVTMDLAPVLDVDGGAGPDDRDPDGTRSFSADEKIASADGRAFAAGLAAGGIVAVVKHFPGLGGATGNTDVVAAATPPWNQLQSNGLLPFEDAVGAHVPAVMVANATVPGLSALPASISSAAIQGVLRGALGFQGLVLTDSLSAAALQTIGYTVPRAAVAALQAGADMILFTADASHVASVMSQTVAAIVSAVDTGALAKSTLVSEVVRVLAAKTVNLCALAAR